MLLQLFAFFALFAMCESSECWSDRLVEVPEAFGTPSCTSEDSLVEWANRDCGQQVETYRFGERCKSGFGGPMHSDIEHICCNPVDEDNSLETETWVLKMDSEQAFRMFKQYLVVYQNISSCKRRGDEKTVGYIVENDLKEFTSFMHFLRNNEKQIDPEKIFDRFKTGSIVTRREFRHTVKEFLFQQAQTRVLISFELILALIEKDTLIFSNKEKLKLISDLRHTKFNYAWEMTIMGPRSDLFPELEAEMHEYYIDLVKRTTIGIPEGELNFIGQSDSTEKLIALYEKILREERWTRQGVLTSSIMFVLWIISAAAFFGIMRLYTWFRGDRENDESNDFRPLDITSDDKNLIV